MDRSRILGTTAIAASLFAGLGFSGIAHAADAASTTSSDSSTSAGEVVVTARARAEKLLEVPISVETFSAAALAADNITDLNSLQYSAGFTFNSQGASYSGGGRQFPTLIFRGMSSSVPSFEGGSSGALFVDGIFVSGGVASVTLADVSQVDVLKGPQNVYFGKNTFGGAINLVTSNPTEEYHASATAGYSYRGSYDDVLSLEGAIIPGLLTGRVTGELFHQGAQYTSGDGGPLGEEDTKGVTVVLYATPTPDIWMRTRFHYSHDDDSTPQDGFIGGVQYGTPCAGFVNNYFCNGTPNLSTLNSNSVLAGTAMPADLLSAIKNDQFIAFGTINSGPQQWLNKVPRIDHAGLDRNNLQTSFQAGAKLPYDTTFQFSAGYNQADADDLGAADHTPSPYFITNTATINRDFEADARILTSADRPWRVVFGVNHFQSDAQLSQGGDYFGFVSSSFASPYEEIDKSNAVYGSLEYDIFSKLTLTGEVRYQHDTVTEYTSGNVVSETFNHVLPRVILSYHPDKETNLYISYSEGIQPPQLQTSYVQAQAAFQHGTNAGEPYAENALAAYGIKSDYTGDPKDRVWEIGLKHAMFDNRLYFDVDYYNEFWDNDLVSTFVFAPSDCQQIFAASAGVYPINSSAHCALGSSGAGFFLLAQNHIQGIEFNGTARITPKFTTHLALNWTDAHRKSYYDGSYGAAYTTGVVPSQNGNRIDLVPEWQGSLDATYKDHLVADYDWYVHGVLNYTGPQYTDPTDVAQIGGYFHADLFAGITKGRYTFEVFCSNLFNDKNWTSAVRFPENPAIFSFSEAYQGSIVTAPNPRDFGFKLSAKF